MWNFRFQIVSRQSFDFPKEKPQFLHFHFNLFLFRFAYFLSFWSQRSFFFFRVSSFPLLPLLKYSGCLQNRERVKFSLHVLHFSFFLFDFYFCCRKSFSFSFLFLPHSISSPTIHLFCRVRAACKCHLCSHVFELQISHKRTNFELPSPFFLFKISPKNFHILVFRSFIFLPPFHYFQNGLFLNLTKSFFFRILRVRPLPSLCRIQHLSLK